MNALPSFLNNRHILVTAVTPVKSHPCKQAGPHALEPPQAGSATSQAPPSGCRRSFSKRSTRALAGAFAPQQGT